MDVDCIHVAQDNVKPQASCEHGDGLSGFIKGGQFRHQLSHVSSSRRTLLHGLQ
jgi:hypothetical protein